MVRLLGPPIARFCVPRASHDWIHVDETAEGFDVSVDTHSTGRLHGTVDLKGPAGEAVIAIDVHLISPSAQVPASPPSGQAGPAQDDEASSAIGLPEAPPGGEPSGPGPQQPDAGGRAGTAEGHGPAGAPSALQVSRPVDAVTFSPDGTRLATGSRGMAHIWDPQAAAIVRGLPAGRRNRVTALAFSPDGTRLATGASDKTVRIWEITTG